MDDSISSHFIHVLIDQLGDAFQPLGEPNSPWISLCARPTRSDWKSAMHLGNTESVEQWSKCKSHPPISPIETFLLWPAVETVGGRDDGLPLTPTAFTEELDDSMTIVCRFQEVLGKPRGGQ